MARIIEEKGIDLLFEAEKAIEEERLGVKITFYGPVAKKDEKYFYDQVQRFEHVDYKGVLNPKDINFVLSEYDALVLLTRYEGEGFPGSILDAYISGIPVLVTDWLFCQSLLMRVKQVSL